MIKVTGGTQGSGSQVEVVLAVWDSPWPYYLPGKVRRGGESGGVVPPGFSFCSIGVSAVTEGWGNSFGFLGYPQLQSLGRGARL